MCASASVCSVSHGMSCNWTFHAFHVDGVDGMIAGRNWKGQSEPTQIMAASGRTCKATNGYVAFKLLTMPSMLLDKGTCPVWKQMSDQRQVLECFILLLKLKGRILSSTKAHTI